MTVLIAGSSGLVGSTIVEEYEKLGIEVKGINSKDVDLTDRQATFEFMNKTKPTLIINAAAKVGGILANSDEPVDFLSRNIQIQTNLLDAAFQAEVENFVFLGSSCIYPRDCQQPIMESYLMGGPLEVTNAPYAIAKISGINLVQAYRKQFGKKWICLMPTNLYGPRDNFSFSSSHVIPGMIAKFVHARDAKKESVELWGDGSPTREFLHVSDLAKAIIFCADNYNDNQLLNVGTGVETSIKDLSHLIANIVGFSGEVLWDVNKPNGTPRKVLDVSRINTLGWKAEIDLIEGLEKTIKWYEMNRNG